jgi:hypothetical protein
VKGRYPIAIGLEAVTRAFLVSFFCGEKKEREVNKVKLKKKFEKTKEVVES